MGSMDADVAIVGMGPAGASAAITLAKHSLRVVAIDKAPLGRDKCCGDGVTIAGMRELEALGVAPLSSKSARTVDSVSIVSPKHKVRDFCLIAQPAPMVIRRTELDESLCKKAIDDGVDVHFDTELTGLNQDDRGVELELANGSSLRARWLIAADGAWSRSSKLLGLNRADQGWWMALRQYFLLETDAAQKMWIFFERDLLPGYAWSFPMADGTVNFGFGVLHRGPRTTSGLASNYRELFEREPIRRVLGPSPTPVERYKAWPIPAGIQHAIPGDRRCLLVGDAAMACDPMTGEGIAQALETGRLAAQSIVAALQSQQEPTALALYSRALKGFHTDARLASGLSKALSHEFGAGLAISLAAMTPWTQRQFGRWLFEDYPRAALATPRRWSQLRTRASWR